MVTAKPRSTMYPRRDIVSSVGGSVLNVVDEVKELSGKRMKCGIRERENEKEEKKREVNEGLERVGVGSWR